MGWGVRAAPENAPRRSKVRFAPTSFLLLADCICRKKAAVAPLPCSSFSAKGPARLACSLASALTTARCRYQPFAAAAPRGSGDGAGRACRTGKHATSEQALYRLLRLFSFYSKSRSALTPLLLLFRKRPRSARLFACKRSHNGSLSLPAFCGCRASRRGRIGRDMARRKRPRPIFSFPANGGVKPRGIVLIIKQDPSARFADKTWEVRSRKRPSCKHDIILTRSGQREFVFPYVKSGNLRRL